MLNSELEAALVPYESVEEITHGVAQMLGGIESLPDEEDVPVLGFLVRPSDEVFTVWTVSPGAFSIFEMSAEGDTLTVQVPLSRVRRFTLGSVKGVLTGAVEIEADRTNLELQGESLSGPGPQDDQRGGRSVLVGVLRPTGYEMRAESEKEKREVRRFFQGLRLALEE